MQPALDERAQQHLTLPVAQPPELRAAGAAAAHERCEYSRRHVRVQQPGHPFRVLCRAWPHRVERREVRRVPVGVREERDDGSFRKDAGHQGRARDGELPQLQRRPQGRVRRGGALAEELQAVRCLRWPQRRRLGTNVVVGQYRNQYR